MPSGKPNFTGLWQVLGTADWDIRDHSAQAGPFFSLRAIGAMPAGQGIAGASGTACRSTHEEAVYHGVARSSLVQCRSTY
jgi:hypothetical protein